MNPRRVAAGLLMSWPALAAADPAAGRRHAQVGKQIPIVAERASSWEAIFDRSHGWTGADGIYSVALGGRDGLGSGGASPTLFVFGDTFIGDVNAAGQREPGTVLVNNTVALMNPAVGEPGPVQFFWGTTPQGSPQALFLPDTPATEPGDWYWLQDGVVIGSRLHWLALRMRLGDGGPFNFEVAGVARLTLPLDSTDPLGEMIQVDAPLHFVPDDGRGEIILGAAVMANTMAAGAPNPDGYVYVYGHQNDFLNKKLLVARVPEQQFEDFGAWRFWDGAGWSPDLEAVVPLTDRISSELSVTPLMPGLFVVVFELDTLGRDVAVRTAPGPTGPFGPVQSVWTCPEAGADPDIYCYNAKAHPHLSVPGELLVSYNVNTFDFWANFADADIYRPRFIRLRRP